MKKFLGNIKRKGGGGDSPERNNSSPGALPQGDAPEAVVVREVTAFCESGAPGSHTAGDEYLHLPAIVDAAESSPNAAKEAARCIRRYLSKDHYQRGFAQYNAIMLTRILTDNPARPFTQNFDAKFVSTIKDLLRDGRDTSVQQILRETLDYLEAEKLPDNDTLGPLVEMWRKEKGKRNTIRAPAGAGYGTVAGGVLQRSSRRQNVLPPPEELATRIEEAKTTARLLVQTVQSTPQAELLANDLVKEFAERARLANKSIQNYMSCDDPSPDEDTMLTLIETNDQLNIAMSKHQRALLQARKSAGIATPSSQPQPEPTQSGQPMPQHQLGRNVYSTTQQPDYGPYSSSPPPRRQSTLQSPVSPQLDNQQFSPPPGPPPSQGAGREQAQAQNYDFADAYAGPAPPIPVRARPPTQAVGQPTSTAVYGVADNPFSDDAYGEHPRPKSYSLFDRTNQTPPSDQYAGNQYAQQHNGQYNAARNGPASNQEQMGTFARNPISPIDEASKRVNDLHV